MLYISIIMLGILGRFSKEKNLPKRLLLFWKEFARMNAIFFTRKRTLIWLSNWPTKIFGSRTQAEIQSSTEWWLISDEWLLDLSWTKKNNIFSPSFSWLRLQSCMQFCIYTHPHINSHKWWLCHSDMLRLLLFYGSWTLGNNCNYAEMPFLFGNICTGGEKKLDTFW